MEADADALYGLPRDEFIARRGELAKSLRKEGRRDEAGEVAALRKPSVAAWAVNQLVRTQCSSVQELFDAGDALRDAQSDLLAGQGDGRTLRSAGDHERTAVDELVARARGLLSSAGDELSPAVIERVADTLHAAALDEDAREQVRDGRLERELRHVGLGLGPGESGVLAPEPRRPRAPADPSAQDDANRKAGTAPRRAPAGAAAAGPGAATATGAPGARDSEPAKAAPKGAAAAKRAAAKLERERAEAERAAAEQARRERAAAVKAARAAEVAAGRRARVAAKALAAAEAHREEAAQALSEAEEALAAARDGAAAAAAAHHTAQTELDDAERRR